MADIVQKVHTTIFDCGDPLVTNLFVMSIDKYGFKESQIKFSIKDKSVDWDRDRWYLITSLNPLKIWSGLAGTFEQSPESMIDMENEIVEEILSWDSIKIHQLASLAKNVTKQSDFTLTNQED